MLIGFLITQKFLFLLLAAAFLIVKLLTLFSLIVQRKNVLSIYENGFVYYGITCRFDEIMSVDGFEVSTKSGDKVVFSESIPDMETVITEIKAKAKI